MTDTIENNISGPPMTFEDLQEKFKIAKEYFESKVVPVEIINQFTDFIAWVEQDPETNLYSQPDLKKYFFEEFVGGLAKRLSLLRELEDNCLPLIHRLVLLLGDLQAKEVHRDNSDLADSLRYLFDSQAPLHQYLFQSEENNYMQLSYDQQLGERIPEDERLWRKSLQPGDLVDAVKFDMEYNLKIWAKATIKNVNVELIEVSFINDTNKMNRYLWWYSPDLSRYDTQSQGEEWRSELKPGDLIDAFDTTRIWYGATIQDTQTRVEDGNEYQQVKVGFRVYNPEGNREDNNKERFFGWSESFDEWIPVNSPRIQKFQTYAKSFEDSSSQMGRQNYEETLDDQMDMLLFSKNPNQTVYAVVRKKYKSSLLVQFLNRLGGNGYYQAILDRLALENHDQLTIENVFYYLDCISKSTNLFNKVFISEYLPKLYEGVKHKILTSSELSLRNIRKERIDGIIQCLTTNLMTRMMTYKQRDTEKNIMMLEIGCQFLTYNFLERRIDGAKYIQEVCKNGNMMTFSSSAETAQNQSFKQFQLQMVSSVIQKIKEKNVIYQIFSKERGHLELLKRSEELLKLFIGQNQLSLQELELIWSSSKIDENSQLELYKLFNEISSRLKLQEITFIIEQLQKVPLGKLIQEQVNLVYEIAKRARSGESTYGQQAVEFMWKIAMAQEQYLLLQLYFRPVDKVLVNQAAVVLTDIIKNWENSYKMQYVEKIVQSLKENREGFLCVKMLLRIIRDFVGHPPPMQSHDDEAMQTDEKKVADKFENRSTFIEHIEAEFDLMNAFFNNFEQYMLKARAGLRQKLLNDPTADYKIFADKSLADKFMHSDQMNERFEFLRYISQNSSVKITKDHLSVLWRELAVHQMFPSDSDLFFKFLKNVCEMYSHNCQIIQLEDLINFFREEFLPENDDEYNTIYKQITLEGYQCIQSFFVLINEQKRQIQRLYSNSQSSHSTNVQSYPAQKFTSFSNTTGGTYQEYSFNQNKETHNSNDEDLDFHILVPPWDLEGIEGIWTIVIDSSDTKVQEKATTFLIKLYTSATFSLENQVPEFEDSFIYHCMKGIKHNLNVIQSRKEPVKEIFERVEKPITPFSTITNTVMQRVLPKEEKNIIKYISLIKQLIGNSEKEGTRGVKSHTGLFRGPLLDCLQIQNSVKIGTKYQSKHELSVYSNTTVWELRKLIGEHVSRVYNNSENTYIQERPSHPGSLRILRSIGCVDLKESENGKTLAELRFKRNETLTAFKRNIYNSVRVPLLNIEKTQLSERAVHIFTQWFNQCSISLDPEDQESKRVMNVQCCQMFIKSATDEDVSETDNQLKTMFETYDTNKDGLIELEEFLLFWLNNILEKEDIVRTNLFNYGYRYDLRIQPLDGTDDHLLQVRPSKQAMPRYKISNDQGYFDSLFDVIQNTETEVSQSAWSLIKTITTNPHLYRKVIALDRDPNFKWSDIFDSQSIHKMLYVLQIVEAQLEESSHINEFNHNMSNQEELTEEDCLKLDWVERFMSLGGFQEILNMFHKSLEIISVQNPDNLSKFEKNFLEQMLKLIRIFVLAAYSAGDTSGEENSIFDVIELVKKKSSTLENEQKKESELEPADEDTKNDAYRTPAKQVKAKFVEKFKAKRVQFNTDVPEITQDFLFGEDNQDKVEGQEVEQQNIESTNASSKNMDASPDDTKKRYSALAKIMRQCGQGGDILQKIDFLDLQNQVLEVICILLGKKELGIDDTQIIENSLSLWVATVIKNGNLINQFYNYKRVANAPNLIRNAEEFISHGLYTYKSLKIREEFSSTIACLSSQVFNENGKKPVLYFIDLLRRNYPRDDLYYISRDSKQYFELFVNLIEEYFKQLNQERVKLGDPSLQSEIDSYQILSEVIQRLKMHESKEKKSSILEDKTQIGYFTMIEVIFIKVNIIQKLILLLKPNDTEKILSSVIQGTGLLEELFYGHLFYKPGYSNSLSENKSKTKESRLAAYSLMQKTVEVLEHQSLTDFLEFKLWNMIKDMGRPKKWKYVPSDNSRSMMQSQFVGLVNLGCICYMNSMLQQFFMVPQFRYQLLKAEVDNPPDIKEYKGYYIDDNLLKQLQIMFSNLELSERQAFYPLGFCFAFKDLDGNPTNTALQQDAQEFLNFFFGRLEELLKPTSQKHLLECVFGGKVCSQLICQSCGNIRNILESYYNLSVQVKDRRGLEDSLQKMIESIIINDFRCENCNQKVDVEKRQLIAEPPNVLIINLQRIIFNFDTFQNDKINTNFEFPNVLNLRDYSFKAVMTAEGRPQELLQQETVKHLMDISDDEYIYKLVGVTIHRGTAEHGHYYSLINTKRGKDEEDEFKPDWSKTEKDPWKVFDDETVKYFNFNDLKSEAFGGQSSGGYGTSMADNELSEYLFQSGTANSYGQNAYMLVYEKMKKKPLKEVIIPPKPIAQPTETSEIDPTKSEVDQTSPVDQIMESEESRRVASLECINTATSRAAQQLQSNAVLDKDVVDVNGEKQKIIQYKKVEQFVPEWIKNQIIEDNTSFLIDRHIYHESFFNFIKLTLRHFANNIATSQYQFHSDYIPQFHRLKSMVLKIAGKSMFDMLSFYNYNTQMSDITSSLQTVFTFCDSAYTLNRGDDSLLQAFIDEWYLQDDCQHFLNIMFDCSDKTSRFYIGKLTTILVNKIYSIYQECLDKEQEVSEKLQLLKDSADKLLVKFVQSLKTPECMKNWNKIEQYLKMIYDIVLGGNLQSHLLLTSFEIVPFLLDFIMANCNSKTSSKLISFEHLVGLICYLVRFSFTPSMRTEHHLWVTTGGESGSKLPPTLNGYDPLLMEEKYPLSVNSFSYIYNCEFVEMALKEGVQTEELGKMIAHLSYKFQKFSRKISKLLLHGISRNDYEKVKGYLDVVSQLAMVKDELQKSRLEWLFGFGSMISHSQNNTNEEYEVQTKIGVKALHSLSDECYQFQSALIQESSDEALLHLLWRYKGRMDTYTVSCLYSLLNLISQDDEIAEYFAGLPGPTYCLSRYTDWFKPYLERQLIDARKGYSGSLSAQKEEIVVKCLSLFDKYESYLKKRDNIPQSPQTLDNQQLSNFEEEKQPLLMDIDEQEENVRNLIPNSLGGGDSVVAQYQNEQYSQQQKNSHQVLRSNPQPYIIVDCVNEKTVYQNDFGNVILQITSLGCFYTESLPTGDSNLSIPSTLFKKSNLRNIHQVGTVNTSKTHNKEQEMQAQCIQNYFQSSGMAQRQDSRPVNTTPRKKYKSDIVQNEEEEQMVDDDGGDGAKPPRLIIKDDDQQWAHVRNDANEHGYDSQNSDQQESQIYKEIPDGSNTQGEPVYKIRVIEENTGFDEQQHIDSENTFMTSADRNNADTNFSSNQNMIGAGQEFETIPETEIHVPWPQDVNYCEELVYRIYVTNFRDSPIKCTLSLTDQTSDDITPINLFYPKGGFKALVQGKQQKTILLLHKLRPEQNDNNISEFNKLAIEFLYKEKYRQGGKNNNAQVYPTNSYGMTSMPLRTKKNDFDANDEKDVGTTAAADGNTSMNANQSVSSDQAQYFDADNILNIDGNNHATNNDQATGINFKDDMGGQDDMGQKQCPQCTLFNPADAYTCDVCEYVFGSN